MSGSACHPGVRKASSEAVSSSSRPAAAGSAAARCEPGPEARCRREGHERLQAGQVAGQLLHHLLDQEVAEGDAAQALLAVADRVEDGRRRLLGGQHLPVLGQELLDRARDLAGERHLDEDQGLVDQRGMEEAEAAPVGGLHPAAQVVPALDLVHGLVADDPLQDVGRRRPVDPAQDQEAAVEPGIEEVDEVIVHAGQLGIAIEMLEQIFAHVDQGSRAARRQIEPAEELLPRRLDDAQQGLQVSPAKDPRRRRSRPSAAAPASGPKSRARRRKNSTRAGDRRAGIEVEHLAGERHARRLATPGEEGKAQALQRLGRLWDLVPACPSARDQPGERSISARPRSAMLPSRSWKKLVLIGPIRRCQG